jgi:hypothetical protein
MNGDIPVSSNLKLGYHMYEKTRHTSKWPESSEVRQSTSTSRARIEHSAGTLYGCYRYHWSATRLPKGIHWQTPEKMPWV